jgi:RNA polymerase sigma-70 factor (ECF subfamily)
MVFSTAARLTGSDTQAEDIAQEVFLKAYENFEQLRTSSTPGGWLKTVATNLTLNHLSRYRARWRLFSELQHRDEGEEPPELAFPAPDTSDTPLDIEEQRVRLEHALRGLPDNQRIPLVLYHFEDMTYQEIAERLRISLSKVKVDILRGRAALAKSLGQS